MSTRTLLDNRAAASLLAARGRIDVLRRSLVGLRSRCEGREAHLLRARDKLVLALARANALVREREGSRAALAEAAAAEAGCAASDGALVASLGAALAAVRHAAAREVVAAAAGAAGAGGGGGDGGSDCGPGSGDLTEAEEAAARVEIRSLDAAIRDAEAACRALHGSTAELAALFEGMAAVGGHASLHDLVCSVAEEEGRAYEAVGYVSFLRGEVAALGESIREVGLSRAALLARARAAAGAGAAADAAAAAAAARTAAAAAAADADAATTRAALAELSRHLSIAHAALGGGSGEESGAAGAAAHAAAARGALSQDALHALLASVESLAVEAAAGAAAMLRSPAARAHLRDALLEAAARCGCGAGCALTATLHALGDLEVAGAGELLFAAVLHTSPACVALRAEKRGPRPRERRAHQLPPLRRSRARAHPPPPPPLTHTHTPRHARRALPRALLDRAGLPRVGVPRAYALPSLEAPPSALAASGTASTLATLSSLFSRDACAREPSRGRSAGARPARPPSAAAAARGGGCSPPPAAAAPRGQLDDGGSLFTELRPGGGQLDDGGSLFAEFSLLLELPVAAPAGGGAEPPPPPRVQPSPSLLCGSGRGGSQNEPSPSSWRGGVFSRAAGGGSASSCGGGARRYGAGLSRGSVASAATTVSAAAMAPTARAWSRATRDACIVNALDALRSRAQEGVAAALAAAEGGDDGGGDGGGEGSGGPAAQ